MSSASGDVSPAPMLPVPAPEPHKVGWFAAVHPDHPFWGPVITVLAWLWGVIQWFWTAVILALVANFLTALLTTGLKDDTDPRKWGVILLAEDHLLRAGGLVVVAALLTIAAYRAELSKRKAKEREEQEQRLLPYVVKQVDQLDPREGVPYIHQYVQRAYLTREADHQARVALERAASQSNPLTQGEKQGICIFGRPTLGKTRLAWETLRKALPRWTFVLWPHERPYPFDFNAQRGKQIALWLDNLHEFVNENEAHALNDLPRLFAGSRLVIVATCRDGDDEQEARKKLESLMERLTPIRPQDIRPDEAEQLRELLKQEGVVPPEDEFDGTPGSVLLGVQRMTGRYRDLDEAARQVLRAMKLLRSVGIYSYLASRIRATAASIFRFDSEGWQRARTILIKEGFVQPQSPGIDNERILVPVANVYLEKAVFDYPQPGEELSDYWPKLEQSFMQQQDADALSELGAAFGELRQGDRLVNNRHAEACCRAALRLYHREKTPIRWTITQHTLGNALRALAERIGGPERADLLEQAVQAYTAALEVFTQQRLLLAVAQTQTNLGVAFGLQTTMSQGPERIALFNRAAEAYQAALEIYSQKETPTPWARTQNNLGNLLSDQARWMEGKERATLLEQAIEAYRQALKIAWSEQDRYTLAMVQHNLGVALNDQATVADEQTRPLLLQQAVQAYQRALTVRTEQDAREEWAETQGHLGIALNDLAEVAATEAECTSLLAQAVEAYCKALRVFTPQNAPFYWARVQNNLGITLRIQAELAQGEQRIALLKQTIATLRHALNVFTPEDALYEWAETQNNLGAALHDLAALVKPEQRVQLQQEALAGYLEILKRCQRGEAPGNWAMTHFHLAQIYLQQTVFGMGQEVPCESLGKALEHVDAAMEVFTPDVDPTYHLKVSKTCEQIKERRLALGCSGEQESR